MTNVRTLIDVNLSRTFALPAAGASAYSTPIDTLQVNPGRVPHLELAITLPATPSLADTKNLTLVVQDGDDGVTYATNPDYPTIVATGAGGAGGSAVSRQIKLPISAKRFLKFGVIADAAAGNNTAISATFSFAF